MGRRRNRAIGGAAALAAAALVLGPVPFGTGGSVEPKRGTYAGGGNMKGDALRWARLGFTFKNGEIATSAFTITYPSCSGGASVPATPVDSEGRFKTVQNLGGTPPGQNRVSGRFVTPNKIKGSVRIAREDPAACGDPGIYKYSFVARRYGGP